MEKLLRIKNNLVGLKFLMGILMFFPLTIFSQINYSCDMESCGSNWDNNGFGDNSLYSGGCSGDGISDNVYGSSYSVLAAYNYNAITGHTGGELTVSVKAKLRDYSSPYTDRSGSEWGILKIYYKTSRPSSGSPGTQIGSNITSSSDCQIHSVTFDPGTTIGNLYICFEYTKGSGDNWIIFDDVTVTESTGPSISYASATYCSSDSDPSPTLTGNAGSGSYSSTSGLVFADVSSNSGSSTGVIDLSASTAGTYTITYTDSPPSTAATFDVTITAAPDAGTISGTSAICSNEYTAFSSDGDSGGTWSSGSTGVATINSSGGGISPVSAGTSTITYTITGTGGCSDATSTRDVVVTAAPNAGTLSGTSDICLNGSTTFSSDGDSGGTWSSGNTGVATINSSTGAISPVSVGTSTITYTLAGSGVCSAGSTATREVSVSENTFYVSTTGSDSNNGLSTGTAFATIQKAIDVSNSSCGTLTVYVADGTYNENDIDIDVSINIIGESESGTIIDNNDVSGEYCFQVTADDADVSIKNITIRDFKGNGGCAFRSYKHDNKVVFDAVTINSCYILSSATFDGAVFIYHDTGASTSDSIVMKNCTFSDNYSAQADHGTALYVGSYNYDYDYPVLITNCVFDNNDSDGSTGSYGACNIQRGYSAEVTKCVFKNNTGHGYNSALRLSSIGSSSGTTGRVIVENCLFHDNSLSFAGAAMGFNYAKGDLTNCTFAQNSNTNSSYYYVSNLDVDNSTITVKNSIFQSDDSGNEMISGGTLSYCIINGGAGGDSYTDGGNNLGSDPSFTNAGSNDFTLPESSPGVDSGSSSGAPSDDIVGTTRDATPDLGCYEYEPNVWTGTTSTAWTTTTNWSKGSVPTSSEKPSIPDVSGASGNFPIITSAVTLAGLTVDASSNINITSNSLTVTGATVLNGTMNIDNSTVNADGTFDATNGTIDFSNTNGKLILSSDVTSLGILDATMGTVEYDGSTQTVFADNYYNLEVDAAGIKTAGGAINVDGNLTTAATAGCRLDMSTYDLNLAGNINIGAADGSDFAESACMVTFDGSADQSITHAGNTGVVTTVTLVSEDFTSVSTGELTEVVSTSSTYQNVANCTTEKWDIESSAGSYAGICASCTGNRATIEYVGSSCTQDNTIITAEFSPTTAAIDISFDFSVKHYSGQYFRVYLYNVTDAAQVGADLVNETQDRNNQAYNSQTTLSGTNSTSDTYSLRFHYYGNNDYGAQFDNVLIQEDVTGPDSELSAVTINKSSGDLDLSSAIAVDGLMTLTSGYVDASSNTITFLDGSSTSGASASSHVKGTIDYKSQSTTKFTFPIGNGSDYEPFSVTPNSTSANTWRLTYSATDQGDRNMGTGMAEVSQSEYFDLSRQSGSNGAVIAFNWDANDNVDTYTDLEIAHFTGGQWEVVASTPVGTNTSGTLTSDAAVTSFSPFAKGSSSSGNLLPVDLLSFEAECQDNGVELTWVTASEENNDYFILEKSQDTQDYEEIAQVMGSGTATIMNEYGHFDYASVDNQLYYRLSQVDFDGQSDVFNPISVNCSVEKGKSQLFIAGNKMNGSIKVQSTVSENQFYDLSVFDASGKQVYTGQGFTESGEIDDQLFIYTQATGIYIVQMVVDGQLYSEKLVW